jgi:hypothetical protein
MPESKSGALTNLATPQLSLASPGWRTRRALYRGFFRKRSSSAVCGEQIRRCRRRSQFERPAGDAPPGRRPPSHVRPRVTAAALPRLARRLANSAKTQAPEPLMRAGESADRQARCSATVGKRAQATASRSLPPKPGRHSRGAIGGESRLSSRAPKIAAVGSVRVVRGRHTSAAAVRQPAVFRRCPRQKRCARRRRPAHRHPARGRSPAGAAGQSSCQRWLRASNTVAASELPPPRPPPSGRCFSMRMSTPCAATVAACSRRAARTVRSSSAGTPGSGVARRTAPSRAVQSTGCRHARESERRSAAGGSHRRACRRHAETD